MKKLHLHLFVVLFSLIYFVFSSGIYFTIHHCSQICKEYKTNNSCSCTDHHHCDTECSLDQNPQIDYSWLGHQEIQTNIHSHHCVTFYYFKIFDYYKIAEKFTLLPWQIIQSNVELYKPILTTETLWWTRHLKNIEISSFFHLEGNIFIDYLNQRIFYS